MGKAFPGERLPMKDLCLIGLFLFSLCGKGLHPGGLGGGDTLTSGDSMAYTYPYPSFFPLHRVDTVPLQDLHRYSPLSEEYGIDLGNPGQDVLPLIYRVDHELGRDHGFTLSPWQIGREAPRYYQVPFPVTRLNYILGAKEEQLIRALHTQNITPELNAGIRFRKLISKGSYDRQETNSGNLSLTSNYRSKDNRYLVRGHYIRNNTSMQLNGGISSDSLFTENIFPNRRNIPVNLKHALYNGKQSAFGLEQVFQFGGEKKSHDTGNMGERFQLYHGSRYRDLASFYKDENPSGGFYRKVLLDSSKTNDISNFQKWVHRLAVGSILPTRDTLLSQRIRFGVRYQTNRIHILERNARLSSAFLTGRYVAHWKKNRFQLRGGLGFRGYNAGDKSLAADLRVRKGSKRLRFKAGVSQKEPPYMTKTYRSNHFSWDREYEKEHTYTASVRLTFLGPDLVLEAGGILLDQPVFYGEKALPVQDKTREPGLGRVQLEKTFDLDPWHLENTFTGQFPRGRDIFRRPRFITRNTFYFKGSLFEEAMEAKIGLTFFYYSSHKGKDYIPATRKFFLQDEETLGGYPFFTPFIDAKVNNMLFFLKMEHANAGLHGYDYFAFPSRPFPETLLKFGVRWVLFN